MKPKSKPKLNLMIDLETVGIRPTSGIISIAAVPFALGDREPMIDPFYERISPKSLSKFTEDVDTMRWWDKQSLTAQKEAFGGTAPVEEVLLNLISYISTYLKDYEVCLWGNAASFDLVLLRNAYDVCVRDIPWNFRNEMCYRTLKNLYPHIKPPVFQGIKHTALADAQFQAAHAELILEYIKQTERSA
jgi:hypothetical protein